MALDGRRASPSPPVARPAGVSAANYGPGCASLPMRRAATPIYGRSMTDRLTALDATFLELEQLDEGATMHIGGVMVFDELPGGGVPTIEQLRGSAGARLAQLPRYTQRLSEERTGGLSWPRWEADPRFDVANHVRQAALPAPGGEAELFEWAGDFFSHRLDRTRPLWEMVLVEGLGDGRWALATKTHHAIVDGVGSVGVAELMFDTEPSPAGPPAALRPAVAEEGSSGWRRIVPSPPDAVSDLASSGARAVAAGAHAALHPREAFDRSRALAELILRDEIVAAPACSINAPIGATRRYTVVRTDLDELKRTGRALGGSVNDVLLAACAGGLRRMLLSRGEEPPSPGLRAMVPMNVREDSQRMALGNRVSSLFVELPVSEHDPLQRLCLVHEETARLKESGAAGAAAAMIDVGGLAPPVLHATIARSLYATRLFNLTITNVPGPRLTLYTLGAPLREVYPLVPLAAEHAIGIAILSYDGHVALGLAADRDSTPDLELLADGIRGDLDELRRLSGSRRTAAGTAGTR